MITEEQASADLDVCGYLGKWNKAKERVAQHVSVDSADYWPNVRKHFLELGGEYLPTEAGKRAALNDLSKDVMAALFQEIDSDLIDPDQLANATVKHRQNMAATESEVGRIIGSGRLVVDHTPLIIETTRRLMALPNAFDRVTGKLNRENDKAVMLYTMLHHLRSHSQFPIYWKHSTEIADPESL